jgi:hypothetical protein
VAVGLIARVMIGHRGELHQSIRVELVSQAVQGCGIIHKTHPS